MTFSVCVCACVACYLILAASEDVDLAKTRLKEMYYNPVGTHAGNAIDTCNGSCNYISVSRRQMTANQYTSSYPSCKFISVAAYQPLQPGAQVSARLVYPVG